MLDDLDGVDGGAGVGEREGFRLDFGEMYVFGFPVGG